MMIRDWIKWVRSLLTKLGKIYQIPSANVQTSHLRLVKDHPTIDVAIGPKWRVHGFRGDSSVFDLEAEKFINSKA